MEINLDSDSITKYVADAIIGSSIGDALKQVIDAETERLSRSYNNPITPVVQRAINDAIVALISQQYKSKIEDEVRKQLTDTVVAELVSKAIVSIMESRH